jgi:thiamine-monophosphate kinase
MPPLRESELLDHIAAASPGLSAAFPHVLIGPGDDCAVIASGGGGGGASLLLKVDQLVEGRHFQPLPFTPLELVARKAIARAISDIAAMGGRPMACTVGAVLPADFADAKALYDALDKWSRHWSCPLVGGDTATWATAAHGPIVLSISVIGTPHPSRGPVLRSGADVGDAVYITGRLGGSLDPSTGHGRHLLFEPRLIEAAWLCGTLGANLHSMMDLSDGLGRDGARMARASNVSLRLTAADIPLSAEAGDWRNAAGDGEDHELLFTAPPSGGAGLPRECPETGTPITRIGTVAPGHGIVITDEQGREHDASDMGFEHGQTTSQTTGKNQK